MMGAEQQKNEPPVCIGTVQGLGNAEIARSFLESAGIPAFLQQNTLGTLYGLSAGGLGDVAIYVPAEFAEEARSLFQELAF